jgi:DNA repair protein RadA/Sms
VTQTPYLEQLARAVRGGSSPVESSVPTLGVSVGWNLLEVGGDELTRSTASIDELPYLPLLGESGWIVAGWSHLLAGYPRVGKTDLMVAQIRRWLDDGHRIIYMTEEPKPMWEFRLAGREGDWSGLRVVFALGVQVAELLKRMTDGAEGIVIVDALRNLLQLKDEKDNSEIARVTNPWVGAARIGGKTLVMLHHQRKGGGEHGEGIAGGHALMGGFDISIEVLRDTNQARNRRLIRSHARLIESRESVYERTEAGAFVMLGDPGSIRRAAVGDRLMALLADAPELRTTQELHDALGDPLPSVEQCRLSLTTLAEQGKLVRDPPLSAGKARGRSHRWGLPKPAQELDDSLVPTELL